MTIDETKELEAVQDVNDQIMIAKESGEKDLTGFICTYTLKQIHAVCRLRTGGLPKGYRTKREIADFLVRNVYDRELVYIELTVDWGKEWTGTYYAETKGRGEYFSVMETWPYGKGFTGCPLGRSFSSAEDAIADFINRGMYEYKGREQLTRQMIVIKSIRDNRETETNPPKFILPEGHTIVFNPQGWQMLNKEGKVVVGAVHTVRVAIDQFYSNYRDNK